MSEYLLGEDLYSDEKVIPIVKILRHAGLAGIFAPSTAISFESLLNWVSTIVSENIKNLHFPI